MKNIKKEKGKIPVPGESFPFISQENFFAPRHPDMENTSDKKEFYQKSIEEDASSGSGNISGIFFDGECLFVNDEDENDEEDAEENVSNGATLH